MSATKTKTRGVPAVSPTAEPDSDAFPPSSLPDVQPTFHVDARALRVFRIMFYTPSLTTTPGEVAWTDFSHAMVSTGSVPEKLYGSVWQFQPTTLDVERSTQFHEPHPARKTAFWRARRVGRRSNRAYGRFGAMFELREK